MHSETIVHAMVLGDQSISHDYLSLILLRIFLYTQLITLCLLQREVHAFQSGSLIY